MSETIYFNANEIRQSMGLALTRMEAGFEESYKRSVRKTNGWHILPFRADILFQIFPSVHISPGWKLAFYQFTGINIHKIQPWAIPNDHNLPEPNIKPNDITSWNIIPQPVESRDFREVISGNGSPYSYMVFPLFEMLISYLYLPDGKWMNLRHIIDINDLDALDDRERRWLSPPNHTIWHREKPEDWRPRVIMDHKTVDVVFYSRWGGEYEIFQCYNTYGYDYGLLNREITKIASLSV
ncbi:MAG: hypothetical protein OHK0022_45030 [Roseiflexaceae bacterium]